MRPPARLLAALAGAGLLLVSAPVPAFASPAPSPSAVRSGEWWLDALHIRSAWSVTKGKGVVVGLIDTGVDRTHPDLTNALTPGADFSGLGVSNGEAPFSYWYQREHGTAMAGFIAGRGHGAGYSLGMLGVAPEAKIMSLSVATNDPPAGTPSPDLQLGKAIRYAVDHGATVLNLSFGGSDGPRERAAIAYAEQHDVVIVGGAGNEGAPGVSVPAGYLGVVAVSGVVNQPPDYPLSSKSNYGPPSIVDRSVPAQDAGGIAVAGPYETTDGQQDLPTIVPVNQGRYELSGGTSNATAVVSGVVALIRAAHPHLKAPDVIAQLLRTATHPAGKPRWSPRHGFGLPNAAAAVAGTPPTGCANPLGSLATNSFGLWLTLYDHPNLTSLPFDCGGASSGSPSSSAAASGPASRPASSAPAAAGSGGSGGVPSWVWVLVAVVVVAGGATALLLARRRSGGHGGSPPPGGYPVPAPSGGPVGYPAPPGGVPPGGAPAGSYGAPPAYGPTPGPGASGPPPEWSPPPRP